LTGALARERERNLRRLEFAEKQLEQLYSPLVGLRQGIRVRSELRAAVNAAAEKAWQELCEYCHRLPPPTNIQCLQELTSKRKPEFDAIIDHDNQQWETELLPSYQKMLEIFRDNIHLADPDTRRHFERLVAYKEVWDRRMKKSLPAEVMTKLQHTEADLQSFYLHLERRHDCIRLELSRGYVLRLRSKTALTLAS
jgi:hypothetical protein